MEFDTEKLKRPLEVVLSFLRDTIREYILQKEQQAYEQGMECGMKNTLAALYEAEVGDGQIISLMSKYWSIPPEDIAKYLYLQKRDSAHTAVKGYLNSQKKSPLEIQSFLNTKVDYHPDLWIYWREPERLISELEKIQP